MRSLRVKRRWCAVKGSVPAGRRRRARVKCSGALSNDRASDDHLGIKIAFACCGNVSFDVPIASPSLAREETKAGVKSQAQACRAPKRPALNAVRLIRSANLVY